MGNPCSLMLAFTFSCRHAGFFHREAAICALICAGVLPLRAGTQIPAIAKEDGIVRIQSGSASLVVEIVRAASQGTVVEVPVKVGDIVTKGECLGHTELYSTKLNLDMAQANFDAKGSVDQAQAQYDANIVLRKEAEQGLRQGKVTRADLDWAMDQEKMTEAQYHQQLDSKTMQKIQLDYWKDEFERRFFRAPVDGTISEVFIKLGTGVSYATQLFTIRNDSEYSVPVTVSAALADTATRTGSVMVLAPNGKTLIRAVVNNVTDDPSAPGVKKVLQLLVQKDDVPVTTGTKPDGLKFDVFIPHEGN